MAADGLKITTTVKPRLRFNRMRTTGIFTNWRKVPVTDETIMLCARAILAWDDMNAERRARLHRHALTFPFRLIAQTFKQVWQFGPAARHVFHRPLAGQIADILSLAVNRGISPSQYYQSGLAEFDRAEFRNFTDDRLNECLLEYCQLATQKLEGPKPEVSDKLILEQLCREAELSCVKSFMKVWPDADLELLFGQKISEVKSAMSLFAKPARSMQGRGACRFDKTKRGYVPAGGDGKTLDWQQLMSHFQKLGRANRSPMLVQEVLTNGPETKHYAGRTLSTVRLATFLKEDGAAVAIEAGLKVAITDDAIVDNYHSGGVYFMVDHHAGIIGPGITREFSSNPVYTEKSPYTGRVITGTKIPKWRQVMALARKAHETLGQPIVAGWDIALTPRGPVIIELNSRIACSHRVQRYYRGFHCMEYAKLLLKQVQIHTIGLGFCCRHRNPVR